MAEHVCIPSKQLLETYTYSNVRDLLTVTDEERMATGVLVNQVTEALRQGFHPQQVYMGGSYKKNTALRGSYDIDLVVFLHSFHPNKMEEYKAQARRSLASHRVAYSERRGTVHALKIDCSTGSKIKPTLHFDLLFTGDPAQRAPGVQEHFYSSARSPRNDKMVMAALERHKGLRELILLAKHWKAQQPFQSYGVTSFYVELVCIDVAGELPGAELQPAFRRALRILAEGPRMEKRDGFVELPAAAREEVRRLASDTLKRMQPEFLYMQPRQIRFTQRNAGRNFRDGRSLEEMARAIATGDAEKRGVEMIRILQHDDGLFYSLDNRRLAAFRLLEFAGLTRVVKARVLFKDADLAREFKRKFDTVTEGRSVKVRGTEFAVGDSPASTTFPLPSQRPSSSKRTAAELMSDLAAMDSDDEADVGAAPEQHWKRRMLDEFNHATQAAYEAKHFAEGEFRLVHRGRYAMGHRTGEACVVKMFKQGAVFEASFFEKDVQVVEEAARLIQCFNEAMRPQLKQRILLNRPDIWTQSSEGQGQGQKMLIEPLMEGQYRCFNSNTGFAADDYAVMQALSHFSYHASGGKLVLCDLQGSLQGDTFTLTDPVVLSHDKRFGPTDLGLKGISNFMARHACTQHCRKEWKRPADAVACLQMKKGTTFAM